MTFIGPWTVSEDPFHILKPLVLAVLPASFPPICRSAPERNVLTQETTLSLFMFTNHRRWKHKQINKSMNDLEILRQDKTVCRFSARANTTEAIVALDSDG